MKNFSELGLPSSLVDALSGVGITTPTPIQEMAIPLIVEGLDVLASAHTGTGKTLAYSLPIIAKMLDSENNRKTALILAPTRELAAQVSENIRRVLNRSVKISLLIGGEAIFGQLKQLRNNPDIIIGTPGRVNDHIKRGSLELENTGFLVLDETDRMLDMGFEEQLESIMQQLPKERQTLLFSATLPAEIIKISNKYLNSPQRVNASESHQPMPQITQDVIRTSLADKYDHLTKAIDASEGSVLIFAKTKRLVDQLATKLRSHDYAANPMHGDLRHHARTRVIKALRDESIRIVVATDIAARGLDIPHIKLVINYDLPQCKEDYIHRIGRTGRAGATGSALCLISPEDNQKWRIITRMLDIAAGKTPTTPEEFEAPRGRSGGKKGRSNVRGAFGNRDSRAPRGDFKKRDGGSSYDKPRGSFGEGRERSRDSYDSRPPRGDFKKRDGGSSYDKPRGSFGENRSSFGEGRERSRDSYDSRSPRGDFKKRDGGSSYDKPRGSFGEGRERSRDSYDSRPPRGDFKKKDGGSSYDKPRGSFGENRSSFGEGRERSRDSYDSRSPRGDFKKRDGGSFYDKPRSSFGENRSSFGEGRERSRDSYGSKSFGGSNSQKSSKPRGAFGKDGVYQGRKNSSSKANFEFSPSFKARPTLGVTKRPKSS